MPPFYIIVNPISGHGAGAEAVPEIHNQLKKLNLSYDLVQTQQPGHAIELSREAALKGYEVVVAAGGDGTVNEVLNGLMLARGEGAVSTAMGVIGIGRGNDFAFGADVPAGLEEGIHALTQNHRRRIDIGFVQGGYFTDGRYFGNGVGIGFDAVVGFEAMKMTKLRGFASYLVAALKTIFLYYHAPRVRIDLNGGMMELDALMVSIMNGRRMGGSFMMAPESHNDDGVLDLCIVKQVSKAGTFALIPRFMQGNQASHPAVLFTRASELTVTALSGSLPAHADGETVCEEGDKLFIRLLPAALDVICSPEDAA